MNNCDIIIGGETIKRSSWLKIHDWVDAALICSFLLVEISYGYGGFSHCRLV